MKEWMSTNFLQGRQRLKARLLEKQNGAAEAAP